MAGITGAGPLRVMLLGTANSDGTITGATSGISQPIDVSMYQNLTFYVTASAALSAGTLVLEEADWNADHRLNQQTYSGTWSTIDTVTLSTTFSGAGGQYAYHVGGPGGSYNYAFVRVRIGTGVVGGTAIVVLRAN